MEEIIRMKEERQGLVKKAREIQAVAENRAQEEKRDRPEFTAEERNQLDRIMAEVRDLNKAIQDAETLAAAEGENRGAPGQNPAGNGESAEERAFSHYLTTGEKRDGLTVGNVLEGGALATEKWYNRLFHDIDAAFTLLEKCDVQEVTGSGSLGAAGLTADVSDPDWTDEVPAANLTPDDQMATKKYTINPGPLTKLVKVSQKFLSATGDQVVRQRLAHKFAAAFENGILNGDGTKAPLGIFTASASGVPTTRDIAAVSQTVITYDDVVKLKRKVSGKYKNKIIICHEDFVTACMLLKDTSGRPLWIDGFQNGEPARLINLPYYESEVAPSTFAADQYVAAVADMSYYLFARVKNVEVQVLDQLFSLTNQVGFKGYVEADGAPMVPEAFARLKMASA